MKTAASTFGIFGCWSDNFSYFGFSSFYFGYLFLIFWIVDGFYFWYFGFLVFFCFFEFLVFLVGLHLLGPWDWAGYVHIRNFTYTHEMLFLCNMLTSRIWILTQRILSVFNATVWVAPLAPPPVGELLWTQTVWLPRLMALVRLIYQGFLENVGLPSLYFFTCLHMFHIFWDLKLIG